MTITTFVMVKPGELRRLRRIARAAKYAADYARDEGACNVCRCFLERGTNRLETCNEACFGARLRKALESK